MKFSKSILALSCMIFVLGGSVCALENAEQITQTLNAELIQQEALKRAWIDFFKQVFIATTVATAGIAINKYVMPSEPLNHLLILVGAWQLSSDLATISGVTEENQNFWSRFLGFLIAERIWSLGRRYHRANKNKNRYKS